MGHLAYNECPKEVKTYLLGKATHTPRVLAEDRGYFKNKECIVQHQGKWLRMLPPVWKQFACICVTKNRKFY